jgi:hypothetical protein
MNNSQEHTFFIKSALRFCVLFEEKVLYQAAKMSNTSQSLLQSNGLLPHFDNSKHFAGNYPGAWPRHSSNG